MTLRKLLKVVPGWEYIKVYKHGERFSGHTCFLDLDYETPILNEKVDHIESLEYEKILIILK